MKRATFHATIAFVAISGCSRPATEAAGNDMIANGIAASAHAACAAGSATLPVTGLCQTQAAALLIAAPGSPVAAPDGCGWTVGEAKISDNTAVLYRAARCDAGTAQLKFAPGAPMGSFTLAVSPYGGKEPKDTIARLLTGADPRAAILAEARGKIANSAEAARCQLRPAGMEGWPADALVIDEVPIPPADGIRSACGEFGLDEGSQTFWRVSQGKAWFFQLGQESPGVDATSFTLVDRTAVGGWVLSPDK